MLAAFHKFVKKQILRRSLLLVLLLIGLSRLEAQGLPSVQQDQFRSQWVGQQVDQTLHGTGLPSSGGLGYLVGSLQTQDQAEREAEAVLAGVNTSSPFVFHPALSLGWQAANQGSLSSVASSASANNSSGFAAPSLMLGYNRDHGPWTLAAGYSAGYRYFLNQNYTGAGTGSAQNPFSQTALFKAALEMSRYSLDSVFSASSGSGFDVTSGSYNLQTSLAARVGSKYTLSSFSSLAADAGYSSQNASGSTATPGNTTTSLFGDLIEIYELSQKTHLSFILGAGSDTQGLQQGTAVAGNAALTSAQSSSRSYGQGLMKIKYDFSEKVVLDAGLGARYITSSIPNSQDTGVSPSWLLGLGYTPTPKTTVTLSSGLQGADVVPSLNLLLSWNPRAKTQFSLGASQSEQFANALSGQYVVSRSLSATLTQTLFSPISLSFTGGYGTQQFLNLAPQSTPGQTTSQLPGGYYYGSLTINWKIREWASLVNTLVYNTAQQQGGAGSTTGGQVLYTISLNLAL
jgi:hypothetical protein